MRAITILDQGNGIYDVIVTSNDPKENAQVNSIGFDGVCEEVGNFLGEEEWDGGEEGQGTEGGDRRGQEVPALQEEDPGAAVSQ